MRRSYLVAATILGTLSVVLIVASLSLYLERPSTLRVAVSVNDADDFDLVGAAAKLAKRGRHGLRFKVVPSDGAAQAARALENGEADIAVVRPDIAMPDKGETVVLLHKDVALLVAPGGSEIEKISQLAGKRIGLLSQRAGDGKLLETALGQYDIAPDAVTTVPLALEDVGAAIRAKTVDAVFAVGQVSSATLQATVRAVAKAGEGPPVFLPVAEAAAVAERLPAYESVEVVRGAFGGTPPRPTDDIDTLGVTTRLVASSDLSDSTVAALTRFLLSERLALAELAPAARRMVAPPTDKGAVMPVHPGTAAYIDDEEETFLEKYSDVIYIGAMVLGVFASGLTAVLSRLGGTGAVPVEAFVGRLLTILRRVRSSTTPAALDDAETEVDAILAEALDRRALRGLDDRKAAALTMAVDQVRAAIGARRHALESHGAPAWTPPANDDPAATFGPLALPRKVLGERTIEP